MTPVTSVAPARPTKLSVLRDNATMGALAGLYLVAMGGWLSVLVWGGFWVGKLMRQAG